MKLYALIEMRLCTYRKICRFMSITAHNHCGMSVYNSN